MTNVRIQNGVEFEVDEKALDDMRFMDLLAEFEDGKIYAMGKMAELLLGKENKAAFYKALENEDGRVPIAAASDALTEIMRQLQPAKN